jgi:hypothetical protein
MKANIQRQTSTDHNRGTYAKRTQFCLVITVLALAAGLGSALAQGTAFTYQGRLNDNSSPANGNYDLRFTIYDSSGGNTTIGTPVTSSSVPVANGLFTVTLDFGAGVFTGPARWLGIEARPAGGGSFTPLLPRQPLTASPYAVTAGNVTGPVGDAQLSANIPRLNASSTFTGTENFNPGAGAPFTVGSSTKVNNLNADLLDGLDSTAFWKLAGNGGTSPGVNFLGTTDNQALELKVNSSRALRLEPNPSDAPNFLAGASANLVLPGTVGAAVGGGGAAGYPESLPPLGGYLGVGANEIDSDFGAIGGGGNNMIWSNSILSVIGGGALNTVQTNALAATVGGGLYNLVQTNSSFATVGGGLYNQASGPGAFVGGGGFDGNSFDGIGNTAGGAASSIVGGLGNAIPTWDHFSSIGGGFFNQISPPQGVYAANTLGATISGGGLNTNYGSWAAIPGGYQNTAQGNYSFAAGQNAQALHNGTFVWADDSSSAPFASTAVNQFLIRANFTGINRANRLSSEEYFGILTPATNDYGGMYIETAGANSKPFYGYSVQGALSAWSYVDAADANKWKLNVSFGDRLTVTAGGLVGIGTTAPDATLSVNGSADKPGGGSWSSFSDIRLKKNVQPLTGALAKLLALRGVSFEYKDPQKIHELPGQRIGMIAQEVERVFPDWVDAAPGGYKRLTFRGFEALTVEALRELSADKDARIAALEHANAALLAELEAQNRLNARWEARFSELERAVTRLSRTSTTTLAADRELSEAR